MLLNNDSFIFSDLRNKNICVIPQTLQKKLYETQSGTPRIRVTGSGDEPGGDGGKEASLQEGHVRSVAPASGRMSSRTPVTPRLPTHSPPSRTGTSSASGGRWSTRSWWGSNFWTTWWSASRYRTVWRACCVCWPCTRW